MTDTVLRVADAVRPSPAEASPVSVSLVHQEADAREVSRLLTAIWSPTDGQEPVSSEIAWVLAHTGNYASLAYVDGVAVGAALAFRARDGQGDYLHSHIAGVLPECQGANVGYELKRHQRDWAMSEGLDRIAWTFDPLVARNAYFNVMKLGADLTDYFVDFYGPMADAVNGGDETDRCLATWWLEAPRTLAALAGALPAVDIETLRANGAAVVLAVRADGSPEVRPSEADVQIVQVPRDIVAVRRAGSDAGAQWRAALREVLQGAFVAGLKVAEVSRDCHYVLTRDGSQAPLVRWDDGDDEGIRSPVGG